MVLLQAVMEGVTLGEVNLSTIRHRSYQSKFLPILLLSLYRRNMGRLRTKSSLNTHEASNLQERPVSSSRVHSVREKVVQGNGRPAFQAVDNVPDRHPASYRPVNRETVQGEPSRTWQADQWASSGPSCRPLDRNNEEEYLSKPGALVSTDDLSSANSSVISHPHDLQISNYTEMNESSNSTGRSSSPSITQKKVPLASTPNNMSLKHSAEEDDFMFDSRSSPGRNRFDHFSSKQPEENSFGSSDVRRYSLHFNERPEENLMGSNDDALRNRPRKSPNTSEPNDQNTQKKTSKTAEGRDRERTVLVTITVASVCLSLYLLWKIQQK
ncbi:mitochondrial antiviral-signaling protein isoform X1 [Bufo gargarizans]|uniref:mitochondrial antiviral-signaling protein isoform X1 n=1 Tax=Bufo gargarizans TaxID=30331 RepID=UPI001CF3D51E|nr:mitochondrial antiviral-signaling protein isoform X1 [Bufo gargarizans]XP_044130817.1 mitochondrial antiviral-signaling protein isoform X1 [Bufo gargarizans]